MRQPVSRSAKRPAAVSGHSSASPKTKRPSARVSHTASSKRSRPSTKTSHAASTRRGVASSTHRKSSQSHTSPSLWTKKSPDTPSTSGLIRRILASIGRGFLAVVAFMGRGMSRAVRSLVALVRRSRVALAVLVMAVLLAIGGAVDLAMNWGKVYPGVSIGEVDVSGKNADEIQALLEEAYDDRLASASATIFANDEAAAQFAGVAALSEEDALAEQRSVEEAQAAKQLWTADAVSLGATLSADALAQEALAVGREEGGIFARLSALFVGWMVEVRADYNADALEALACDIDATIGNPRVDFGIAVEEGQAHVTEGHDGSMVNRATLAHELDQAYLANPEGKGSFVAHTEYAPLRIDCDTAQEACNTVNAAIADGAHFSWAETSWDTSAEVLGDWVVATPVEREGTWILELSIDEAKAKPAILAHAQQIHTGNPVHVTFERTGDEVLVHTDGAGDIPLAAETAHALSAALFVDGGSPESNDDSASAYRPAPGQPVEVTVGTGTAPEVSTFDEALSLGIVAEISSYTTDFTNTSSTKNRNHNIRLVADLLNNSIAPAGGTWSFNNISGECNAERGFLGAGAIVDGEYSDAVGGGICQVATTVFNAVYDAGYPVPIRHNHTLYIASYPAGRDAAVSWDELDLVWENDTASDILLRTSYTDTSVTVTLYGVDPGYRVTTEVGEWVEGEKHKTRTEHDESLEPGTSKIKTEGTDGKKITVIRMVTSFDGNILHEDAFYSTYAPITEIVLEGPENEDKTDDEGTEEEPEKKKDEEG